MQKTAGVNINSHTPSILTTKLLIFWTQVLVPELRFSAKADDIFCSDTAILKLIIITTIIIR